MEERPAPSPGPDQIRVAVEACAVCRTDLHVVDCDLPHPRLPLMPGHEIVGRVDALGPGVRGRRVGERIGIYGFGAAAYIITQVCTWQGRHVLAFTRPGDVAAQDFARSLSAVWAGGSDEAPPESLEAAIIFAPVSDLVPVALRAVRNGGRVVCGGIHMSDIPRFPYRLLWEERQVASVANLTRRDALDFLAIAPKAQIRTLTVRYPLGAANEALDDLRSGRLQGAAVLVP